MRVTGVAVLTRKSLFSIYLWIFDNDTGMGGFSLVPRVLHMCTCDITCLRDGLLCQSSAVFAQVTSATCGVAKGANAPQFVAG